MPATSVITGEPSSSSTTAETASTIRHLLKEQRRSNERDDASRLDELRRIFARLASSGDLAPPPPSSPEDSEAAAARNKWSTWLQQQHTKFVNQLCCRVRLGRRYALRTLCGVVAGTPCYSELTPFTNCRASTDVGEGEEGRHASAAAVLPRRGSGGAATERMDEVLVYQLLDALCARGRKTADNVSKSIKKSKKRNCKEELSPPPQPQLEVDDHMLSLLSTEFIQPYLDVQYFTMLAVRDLAARFYSEHRQSRRSCGAATTGTISGTSSGAAAADKEEGGASGDDDEEEDGQRKKQTEEELAIVADNLLKVLELVPTIPTSCEEDIQNRQFLFHPPLPAGGDAYGGTMSSSSDNDEDGGDDGDEEEETDSSDEDEAASGSRRRKRRSAASTRSTEDRQQNKRARHITTTKKTSSSAGGPILLSPSKYKRILEEAWLSLLRLAGPHVLLPRTHKRALQLIPDRVLPYVHHPLRFADYCTQSYNVGGITSILSLNGLFLLMTRHGLEYPQFYQSLYALVRMEAFYARYRTRFFKLLTACLSGSTMLPAYVVAAFCKRLCRCALEVPPSGALFVLALVSNLLRRHGACGCLVHRGGGEPMQDVYDADTDDVLKSRALESSLWELTALEKHFHPAVATLARVCGREDNKTPLHDMDEFLLHTYQSLFEQESKRRMKSKKTTPLTFREPESLFVDGDVFSSFLATPKK